MAMLPSEPDVELASFTVTALSSPGKGLPALLPNFDFFQVPFNPASLEYSISNEFDDRNGNNGARQFVKKSTAKLSMTLVFDTTMDGSDVRAQTERLARLMKPARDGKKNVAPKLTFGWGSYSFQGVIEQYKETLDFFSASGVPLRATVNLTLSAQEVEFQSSKNPNASVDSRLTPEPVDAARGLAPSDVAFALGDPRAARLIASRNVSASLRFAGDASLSVGGAVSIGAPVAFSGGASASLGGGFWAGGGLSLGGSVAAGAGLPARGGQSVGGTAGLSASAGAAFAGLRVGTAGLGASIDNASARSLLLPAAIGPGALAFGPGGRASASGGASLAADVGATADLHARVGFGA